MSYTKKETDFWGNEKEIHYDDQGNKVGETRYRATFSGDKVQDHYDASGTKTGETRRQEGLFGDKAVHYDADGKQTGYTKDHTTFCGDKIQRHFGHDGEQVGKSHYEDTLFSGRKKVHEGGYFKARNRDKGSSPVSSGTGSRGRMWGGSGIRADGWLAQIIYGVVGLAVMAGAIWVNDHTTPYSFLWFASLVVMIVSFCAILPLFLICLALVVIIAAVSWLIEYFVKHPW